MTPGSPHGDGIVFPQVSGLEEGLAHRPPTLALPRGADQGEGWRACSRLAKGATTVMAFSLNRVSQVRFLPGAPTLTVREPVPGGRGPL